MKEIFAVLLLVTSTFCGLCQEIITTKDIQAAEKLADLVFSPAKEDSMLSAIQGQSRVFAKMHKSSLANDDVFPFVFNPVVSDLLHNTPQQPVSFAIPAGIESPRNKNDLAFYTIPELASLIKSRKITSLELATFFLDRLKKYGDTLQCVISITEEIAISEAKQADQEIAAGEYRGPLHGIPYGLKDLFSVKNTKTTWGAEPYRNQVIDENSYVYSKLKAAGAVLVAKLTLGALAMGDNWYGGQTKNPWNLKAGSSGSSAGSAAATVAGLVPFAIGTETYGSIISPSTTCGATGLRATFGSISRSGAMTLSWTLDKPGPICKSAEDAAIVFYYIKGTDGKDPSAVDMPFNYKEKTDITTLKIGYARNYFKKSDTLSQQVLDVYRKAGATLIPFDFSDSALYPFDIMDVVISSESAAAFDAFTRTGLDDKMTNQTKRDWPNFFRAARFIPAVEYINANRHRYLMMQKLDSMLKQFDIIICPTWAGKQAAITNLSGHPALCMPIGFSKNGSLASITLLANLYDEATLLQAGKVYQEGTGWNKMHPPLFK